MLSAVGQQNGKVTFPAASSQPQTGCGKHTGSYTVWHLNKNPFQIIKITSMFVTEILSRKINILYACIYNETETWLQLIGAVIKRDHINIALIFRLTIGNVWNSSPTQRQKCNY